MTKFAACHTGTQTVVADTNRFVFERISKIVIAFSHGSNEDADAFFWCKSLDIVSYPHDIGIEAKCDLPAMWWKMICDWVFDDFEELLL